MCVPGAGDAAGKTPEILCCCSRLTEKIKEQGGTAERHQARAACRCLNSKFQEAFEDAQLCTMLRPDW